MPSGYRAGVYPAVTALGGRFGVSSHTLYKVFG